MRAFTQLFDRNPRTSREVAKSRLQQVLGYDRVSLSPGIMDQLRSDMTQVISKYVEIDQRDLDIALTSSKRRSHLTAQVPIVGAARK